MAELREYIALFFPLGPERWDSYVRSIVGVLLGQPLDRASFPFPWETGPRAKRKPPTEQDRKVSAAALRKEMADEIMRTRAGVS